jgi:hypothetical protein
LVVLNGTEYIREPEAAHIIGVKPGTLRNWRSDQRPDRPDFIKIGAGVFYAKREVEDFARTFAVEQ